MDKIEAPKELSYSGEKFSYARPEDPFFKKLIIRTIERLSGSRYLQQIYKELHEETPNPFDVWSNALRKLNISYDYPKSQLEKVPSTGPLIFVANHPFGILDGAIFLDIVTKVRRDYFLLINEVLSHEAIVAGHLLPVDFRPTEEAKKTNLETKRRTTERLRNGEALAIFPSGGVATIRSTSGIAEEFPWRRFICGRIHETQCTVVPIYFHGQNSFKFHLVSWISVNMRLGLLLHELMNKRGQTIKVNIGDPITYNQMAPFKDRQELIEFLYEQTMSLKNDKF